MTEELLKQAEELIKALADELRGREWQPIETAPKNGTIVCGYEYRESLDTPFYESSYNIWFSRGEWRRYNGRTCLTATPTMWTHLPREFKVTVREGGSYIEECPPKQEPPKEQD